MLYKAVFKNSKVALLFAAIAIVSAVSMVGTSEDGGPLLDAVSKAKASHAASGDAAPPPPPPSVFGEYNPNESVPAPVAEPMPAIPYEEAEADGTMPEPLAPDEGLPAE